jgi:hypothetical protein
VTSSRCHLRLVDATRGHRGLAADLARNEGGQARLVNTSRGRAHRAPAPIGGRVTRRVVPGWRQSMSTRKEPLPDSEPPLPFGLPNCRLYAAISDTSTRDGISNLPVSPTSLDQNPRVRSRRARRATSSIPSLCTRCRRRSTPTAFEALVASSGTFVVAPSHMRSTPPVQESHVVLPTGNATLARWRRCRSSRTFGIAGRTFVSSRGWLPSPPSSHGDGHTQRHFLARRSNFDGSAECRAPR